MKKRSNLTRVSLLYAALLIWLGMACAAFPKVAPVADITGTWRADVVTPEGDELEVILHISKSPEGVLIATMDVPVMGAYGAPLTFSFENGVVHYEIEQAQVSFDGKLIDPSTIEGLHTQPGGGDPGTLTFKRVE